MGDQVIRVIFSLALAAMLLCFTQVSVAQSVSTPDDNPGPTSNLIILTPPYETGPVVVQASFEFRDILEIIEEEEVIEFSGVLTLKWNDPRQAFDPEIEGVEEMLYTGNYQFNESSPGWYPQVVLSNENGMYQSSGVVLRVRPDGTSTLIQTIVAGAETDIDVRQYPFDKHRFQMFFEVLGFDQNEVVIEVDKSSSNHTLSENVHLPQWNITGYSVEIMSRNATHAGGEGVVSSFVISVEMARDPFFIIRLVVLPLCVIVLLSFAVFWMDRSSLGDRISVSFIGILTGVAYQLLVSDQLPSVSYFTLIHGFLNLSFLTMCATVVINIVVGRLDLRGAQKRGDAIDFHCRWIFPVVFFGLSLVMMFVAFAFF
jgi:Neurotransmitter-gated ion-channel ligand binding domain/Neurotransmitter-gated ion-channel transmembrane region